MSALTQSLGDMLARSGVCDRASAQTRKAAWQIRAQQTTRTERWVSLLSANEARSAHAFACAGADRKRLHKPARRF